MDVKWLGSLGYQYAMCICKKHLDPQNMHLGIVFFFSLFFIVLKLFSSETIFQCDQEVKPTNLLLVSYGTHEKVLNFSEPHISTFVK